VANAIRVSSLNASAGQARTTQGDISLTSRQLADTSSEFGDIVIRQTPDGALIRIGDVANVVDGFSDGNLDATYRGQPMTMIGIQAGETMNVVQTANQLEQYIQEKSEALPEGINLELWLDNSTAYESRMDTISTSALIGLSLVFVVLMLFLRPIVAIWVTVGIAIAFAGGTAFLPYAGVSLNMLSLFAFLLVTGVVVDDAIVVGENIHNQVERGKSGIDAAIIGTQMVAKPVVFAVITTIMAFAPWMLLTGPEVQFTRQISLVVTFALIFSLIESFLILPAHLSHLKPQNSKNPLLKLQQRIADGLIWFARNVYRPLVEIALKIRYVTISLFISAFILAIGLQATGWLNFNFMPNVESEFVQVRINFPEGTPFSRVESVKERVDAAIDIVDRQYKADYGDDAEMFNGGATFAFDGGINGWIKTVDPEVRPGGVPTSEVAQRLRDAVGPIPDAEEIRFSATFNSDSAGIMFSVSANDSEELRRAVDELKAQLATYDNVYDITDNLQSSTDEVQLSLKPGAQSLGITLADVTKQVRQAYFGEIVQRLPRNGQDVEVRVRYPEADRQSLDTLRELRIRTNDGREVPLDAVADVSFEPGIQRINRRDRMRSVNVSAETVTNEIAGDVREDLEANFFPEWQAKHPGVRRGLLGDQQGQAQFMQELMVLQLMMFGGMYILLAVAFRSYWQPLMIMTAIPFATAGAYFGHLVHGLPLALFSFFGIGAAAGVVINDNLVLVDRVNTYRKEGMGAYQALVEAGTQRFRPILLTTVTTFVGIMPIMAEQSTQAAFLKPMVVSLAYGVVFALFLTLFMVPALYGAGVDTARFFRGLWTGEKQPKFGSSWDEEAAHGVMPDAVGHQGGPKPAPAE